MANLKEKTKVTKGFNGWSAETFLTVNNQDFKITTQKSYKKDVVSSYRPVTMLDNGSYSFELFDQKQGDLLREQGKATEKKITEVHNKALLIFDEKIKDVQPIKKTTPVIGSILFSSGLDKEKGYTGNEKIVYEIENTSFGVNYKTVEKTTKRLDSNSYVKNINEKFGIGTYFEDGYITDLSKEELNNLVIEAHQQLEEERKAEDSQRLLNQQLKEAKIEEGKKLVSIPDWAKSVIVADLYENQSDGMTDYFHTTVKKTFFLAFSKTTRNNMNELEKACNQWEETKELLKEESTERYTYGHSYLPDYFIGSESWSGLKVNKRKFFDLSKEENRNLIYIAAAEERCFFSPGKEEQKTTNFSDVQIVDYSEKAIAVIGETKPIKEQLKSLGGRFNFRLSCGAGWIFPKTKLEEVTALLQN